MPKNLNAPEAENECQDDELTDFFRREMVFQAKDEMTNLEDKNAIIAEKISQIQEIEDSLHPNLDEAQIERKKQEIRALDEEICELMDRIYSQLKALNEKLDETAESLTSKKALKSLLREYRKQALQVIEAAK